VNRSGPLGALDARKAAWHDEPQIVRNAADGAGSDTSWTGA